MTGFGESSFKVTFIFFVRKGADYFGTLNGLNLEILKRFADGGIDFAVPTRLLRDQRDKAAQ